jgi:hypothetical protein
MSEPKFETDALSPEYKRDCGTARGNLEVSNLVNNAFINSPLHIFRFLSAEETRDLTRIELRSL